MVIDPTPLEAPNWTQLQFHAFWTRLITDYVGTVVFNAGWEYSTGCCYEFAAAVNAGARLLDDELSPVSPKVALMLTLLPPVRYGLAATPEIAPAIRADVHAEIHQQLQIRLRAQTGSARA